MEISIAQAKAIREELGATHLIILAADAEGDAVATHGETEQQALDAARSGNALKTALGWPAGLCNAKPLARICGNCAYFKSDRGTFFMNTGYDERVYGQCMVQPVPVPRAASDRASQYFEPIAK